MTYNGGCLAQAAWLNDFSGAGPLMRHVY